MSLYHHLRAPPPFNGPRIDEQKYLVLPRRIQVNLTDNVINLGHHLWCQLVQCLQGCTVLHHLLWSRSARDDGRHVLVLQAPCKCQLCPCDLQLVRDRLVIPRTACQLCSCQVEADRGRGGGIRNWNRIRNGTESSAGVDTHLQLPRLCNRVLPLGIRK